MKVYLKPASSLSRAMLRVSDALKATMPGGWTVVDTASEADLVLLHVIGSDVFQYVEWCNKPYAVIQYTRKTAGGTPERWEQLWRQSVAVWSYYDLGYRGNFYHAPLGVDARVFRMNGRERPIGVVSSGYVNGSIAEAIEEVADAAMASGLTVFHLGPKKIEGMDWRTESTWWSDVGISDARLSATYAQARWVSGLRHVEGFELPVLEGLMCGARPIVFDRDEMRRWFDGHVVFIPECQGPELVKRLADVFQYAPQHVSLDEREQLAKRFAWPAVTDGFWKLLQENV